MGSKFVFTSTAAITNSTHLYLAVIHLGHVVCRKYKTETQKTYFKGNTFSVDICTTSPANGTIDTPIASINVNGKEHVIPPLSLLHILNPKMKVFYFSVYWSPISSKISRRFDSHRRFTRARVLYEALQFWHGRLVCLTTKNRPPRYYQSTCQVSSRVGEHGEYEVIVPSLSNCRPEWMETSVSAKKCHKHTGRHENRESKARRHTMDRPLYSQQVQNG